MHMKIPDPYAAWMRRLLIVEVVCFLMLFSLGCAGKTAEDAQEAFPFETVQLTSEYGTLYIVIYTSILIFRENWQRDPSEV